MLVSSALMSRLYVVSCGVFMNSYAMLSFGVFEITSAKTGQNVEQILGGIAARRVTCGMQALPTLQTLAWATALLEQPATALCELPLDIIALVATHVHAVRTPFDS